MAKMMSLRARITLVILLPLLIVASMVGYWAYQNTRTGAEMRFDGSLMATATAIVRDIAASDGDALSVPTRDLIADTSGGHVFYHVYAPDGVFVTGYATPPVPDSRLPVQRMQFYDARYHDSSVRVLRLREDMQLDGLAGTFNFTVWQDTLVREVFVKDQSRQTFIVIAILTTSVALIVWIGVGVGLRPLLDLQHAISIRTTGGLTPIRRAVPEEVMGIVATLNSLLDQVGESMQAKNVFISNAAHQLRNPVAGVMAMAEAVISAPDAKSAMERTEDLYESAQQASDLANKLISFERANRAGSEDFHKTIDLLPIIQSVVSQTRRRASNSIGIELSTSLSSLWIDGDALMIEEAVTNLIDNSFKYGGADLSVIEISVLAIDGMAEIRVADNGVGMNEDEISRALERFGQLNPGSGSGLGLSIVQSVSSGHGGSFSFQTSESRLIAIMLLPMVNES